MTKTTDAADRLEDWMTGGVGDGWVDADLRVVIGAARELDALRSAVLRRAQLRSADGNEASDE